MSSAPRDYDDIPIIRSYERDVVRRLNRGDASVESIGGVQYGSHAYRLWLARYPLPADASNPTVWISGGVHGEEPAGVHAALDFLEEGIRAYSDRCNFVMVPCVNPSGYEAGTRKTMSEVDLNRSFGLPGVAAETDAVQQWLAHHVPQFLLALDLHESLPESEADPRQCYLYETVTHVRRRIGRTLMDQLPEAQRCQWPTIYGDLNQDGVISYPEGCRNPEFLGKTTTLDAYMNGRYAEHTITTETPTMWPLEKRIATQLLWVRKALDRILSQES